MQRVTPTSILAAVLLAALASSTYWLVQRTLPSSQPSPDQPKHHTPDYYADNISISMLSATGQTQYRINAATMVHYEDDSTTSVTRPAIRAFTPGQPEVTATALRGTINGDDSVVDLYDQAVITRAPDATDPGMKATSQHFQVLVNDDIVRTELPVQLTRGQSVMTASGMNFNNVTRVLQLLGSVRGTIMPAELNGSRDTAKPTGAKH
ncbi:LPS export ABC transporter periplasmic protein LptC [Pandoraea sp.]|uniref:LPS export ABC transporter periplasmic protein LptC n=1 Tax=Pandoraea sp. TaxID=1883445 RepID=UPI00120C345E|nr:LPS export ABC transporter periplasmic protein LptC [Pandoraea sp.]MBU6492892.1 LPS export ABC transporter periplasmic protein LptC [Burkholderiales bacterium]MDE2287813.1 LPS export ABC transporter periplasmic protein LptC [Burkholderiales bacterium]MDE2611498.1 LPS export ABC transporter periplasmic protein LptC [Burkholderiales bacterium]TAL54195.1 MAG: LPS export ABC transporter periplasmic protein LptC [Pandoraea sp.]TAM15838.1 MAG: LPS export ABC transporter periplasmic protein LptC [